MERVFEWDDEKAVTNDRKHGVRFEEAVLVFEDPFAVSEQDRIENGEQRYRQGELPPLTEERKAELKALAEMPEDTIDYSAIPPLEDAFWEPAVRIPLIIPARVATSRHRDMPRHARTQLMVRPRILAT